MADNTEQAADVLGVVIELTAEEAGVAPGLITSKLEFRRGPWHRLPGTAHHRHAGRGAPRGHP